MQEPTNPVNGRERNDGTASGVKPDVPAACASPDRLPGPAGAPTVLVVEDELVLRLLAAANLRDLDFAVIEAANGEEAVAVLRSQPVDLVFTDVRMPGTIDGIGLVNWIDGHRPGLPVLLTSGSFCDLPAGLRRSDRRLIGKPYALAEVTNSIKVLLSGR